jgi:hypothetical protein
MKNSVEKKEKNSIKDVFVKMKAKARKRPKLRYGDTLDMDFQWKVALAVLVLTAIISLTFAIILFERVGGRSDIGFTNIQESGVENIDTQTLQDIVEHYEEKRREHTRFEEGFLSVPTPTEDILPTELENEEVEEPLPDTSSEVE